VPGSQCRRRLNSRSFVRIPFSFLFPFAARSARVLLLQFQPCGALCSWSCSQQRLHPHAQLYLQPRLRPVSRSCSIQLFLLPWSTSPSSQPTSTSRRFLHYRPTSATLALLSSFFPAGTCPRRRLTYQPSHDKSTQSIHRLCRPQRRCFRYLQQGVRRCQYPLLLRYSYLYCTPAAAIYSSTDVCSR
jgi:hypothetical protein